MEDAFPPLADEETQHPPSTEQPSTESQPAEPTSTEHQSPSPNKDHPESSKEKQQKEFDQSPDASDSKSLLCSNTNYWVFGPKSVECTSVLHQPDGAGSEVRSIGSTRQLNGIMVALIA
ncbi:hypothetical protein Tco_1474535 [Tanacetum coccineum]